MDLYKEHISYFQGLFEEGINLNIHFEVLNMVCQQDIHALHMLVHLYLPNILVHIRSIIRQQRRYLIQWSIMCIKNQSLSIQYKYSKYL